MSRDLYEAAFCDTPFWNQTATWNTTTPALTRCFTDTAMIWTPSLFLLLCCPWTFYDYLSARRPSISWNRYNLLRLLAAISLALVGAAHSIYVIVRWSEREEGRDPTTAELTGTVVSFASWCLLVVFVHFQRLFGFVNGGVIWFYLFLQICATGLSIPTFVQYPEHRNRVEQVLVYVELGLQVALLLICSFADRVPNLGELLSSTSLYGQETVGFLIDDDHDDSEDSTPKKKKKICPKETASFPSKLTFWWFNSIALLGFRRPLVIDDLWAIRRCDRATNLFRKFNQHWKHKSFSGDENELERKHPRLLVNGSKKLNGGENGLKTKKSLFGGKNTYLLSDYNLIGNGNGAEDADSDGTESLASTIHSEPPPKTNVITIMAKQFWRYFLFPSSARFITDNLQLVNPIVMKYMISFTTDYDAPFWQGIFYTLIFVLTNVVNSFASAYHQHRMSILGMRIRTCLLGAIYRKSLVLAMHSKKDYTTGEIVNLMAVDCQRFIDLLPWFCFLWTAPVQIGIALWLLWQELGISVLGGLVLMILFIPINGYIAGLVKKIQTKQMALKDKRLKAINEMLNGIKVLKLYAWEEAFIQNIQAIRIQELKYIRRSGYISTIFNLISACSPFMVSCLTFTLFIFIDPVNNVLTAEKAFVSIALFNLLRVPLAMIPNMMSNLILTLVSVKRLNKFLNSDETTPYVQRKVDKSNAITVTNGSFNWDRLTEEKQANFDSVDSPNPGITLSDINDLTIPKGSLVAIVGSVGSGKSSFLYALLGEMQKLSGKVNISGDLRLAYVAQQAWIQNSSVRGNILFGSNYEVKKYQRVIEACALKPDFEMLTAGDETEIGEKGINLSGGQKQRVSIARACYSDADLYLFDDPLSAVDSHVGKHIFDEVLSSKTGILASRTRILVTNALYMLPNVDQIVLLKAGTIEAVGTYDDLLQKSNVFYELISNYTSSNLEEEKVKEDLVEKEEVLEEEDVLEDLVEDLRSGNAELVRSLSLSSTGSKVKERSKSTISIVSQGKLQPQPANKSKLVQAEHVESGQVTFTVYRKFISSLSTFWSWMILANYFLVIAANTGSNFWLSAWTSAADGEERSRFYLVIYFVIGMTQVLFVAVGWISIVKGTLLASKTLHWKLMSSIVHAPMHFFDTTPLGRIVNRFSKDIDVLDTYMAFLIRVLLNTSFQVLATLFIVSFQTPLFLAIVIPFIALYYFIQRFYVATSRQLKRLESVTRSPIFTHFSETINGVSTIKAYSASERFIIESDKRVDENQRCFYPNAVSNCWLQVRLEFMANCLIFFASLFAALSKKGSAEEAGGLDGSGTGLSLSYALNVTLSLNFCVRMFADMENNVVSVERISEYTDVEPEAEWRRAGDEKVEDSWPQAGEIRFDGYGTRYRPGLDLVLRKIDIATQKGEKIGIVGRTGAGKSSLTLALFRIIEATNGKIWMDGIDIATLGLQTLRSRITIIPQDPVLFCGSIRSNLDPFSSYTDEQLWAVLELSHLKAFVKSLDLGLAHPIAEGGENLSVGQRQLICLARALLRRTNVLVLDEATAAVDLETDSLIQATIRAQFAHCTVLTIAHRLNTIMDSDRVMVLDAGNVAEFDSPKSLLADERSIFYSLAKDAGIVA